jgi:predicted amidophosphoribosyltransferase
MVAMARLEGPVRAAIHRLKYGDRPQLAGPIVDAALILRRLAPGVLVPVPLHPARRLRRGYNQAELLAREVARRQGSSWLGGLRREAGGSQVGRGGEARRGARGGFRWIAPEVPRGVLILDDVMTTGTTLLECAAAAREAGVERVDAAAIALG